MIGVHEVDYMYSPLVRRGSSLAPFKGEVLLPPRAGEGILPLTCKREDPTSLIMGRGYKAIVVYQTDLQYSTLGW